MIRYFTYYSCGGYKDIYVGSDNDSSPASYFIPLLNDWKKLCMMARLAYVFVISPMEQRMKKEERSRSISCFLQVDRRVLKN